MEERKKTGKSYLWALFAFLLAVAADQFTKWLAVTYLKDQDPLIIIPGVFQFRYLENRGAAFGILQNRQIVFAVGALLIFFAVVFIYGRIPEKKICSVKSMCDPSGIRRHRKSDRSSGKELRSGFLLFQPD